MEFPPILLMLLSSREKSLWTWLMAILTLYHKDIFQYIETLYRKKSKKERKVDTLKYEITGTVVEQNRQNLSFECHDHFKSLAHKIKSIISKDETIKNFQIFRVHDDIVFFNIGKPLLVSSDIAIETSFDESMSKEKNYRYIEYKLTLSSTKTYAVIESFLDDCRNDWIRYKNADLFTKKIFIVDDTRPSTVDATQFSFDSTKSFQNTFFDDKEKVLSRIQAFQSNKDEYVRLGIPYTLGILLHGIPGSGKTSFIKSLAKLMNRHLVIVPSKNVRDAKTLKNIFYNSNINHLPIPNEQRLYVFDDIDCSDWKDVVMSRSIKEACKAEEKRRHTAVVEDHVQKDICPKQTTLVLADLLELFDGLVETPGRVVIMTTNHPELLDPALLRPGRLDIVIEFKKLSKENVNKYYKTWFNTDIPQDVYDNMKDRNVSQADLGNMFASKDFETIHKKLVE